MSECDCPMCGGSGKLSTRFWHFRQNNSGGNFTQNNWLDVHVVIEAKSAAHANERAKKIGIYFDGVDEGIDCGCCGDRWYPASGVGYSEPAVYSVPVRKYRTPRGIERIKLHWLDSSLETIKAPEGELEDKDYCVM